jgi:hypothetical protein
LFEAGEFRRRADGRWTWCDQVIADDYESLRPKVALMAAMSHRQIATWTREGDVVTVTTKKKRPCRAPGGGR